MNHYETLHVAQDATPDEIKAAFRREAAKAHPDREGGSTKRMAEVNEAYDVLSDLERRKRYDETGSSQEAPSIDAEARGMLAAIFTKAVEQDHCGVVEFARNDATQLRAQLAQQREMALAKIRKLEGKRAKVRTKGDSNLVHGIIDQQLASLREAVGRIGRGLEVVGRVSALLDAYDEDAPPQQAYGVGVGGFGFWQQSAAAQQSTTRR